MNRRKPRPDGRGKKRPGVDEQRKVIVDAAIDLFISRGSRAVSISQICSNADVSRHTYYRCFEDKEDLIRYLYQSAVNEHIETMLSSMQMGGRGKGWNQEAFDWTVDAILEKHKLAQFVFVESSDPTSPAFKIVDDAFEEAAGVIQSWAEKSLGSTPSIALIKSTLVAAQWLVHDAIRAGMTPEAIAEAKSAGNQLFYGLFLATQRERKARS